jgi:uncharacterized membrane protein
MGMKPRIPPGTRPVFSSEERRKEIHRLIREECERIGRRRDKLRALRDELTDILETTDEGLEMIEEGLDRLSEHL